MTDLNYLLFRSSDSILIKLGCQRFQAPFGKVRTIKGALTVQSIQISEPRISSLHVDIPAVDDQGTLSTVTPAISASRGCLPPFVILKGKHPSDQFLKEAEELRIYT